jgi:hypothetical protein
MRALTAVVHENATPKEAHEIFSELKAADEKSG